MRAAIAAAAALLTAAAAPAPEADPSIPAKVGLTRAFDSLDDDIRCKGKNHETLFLNVANEGKTDFHVRRITLRAPADLEFCDPKTGRSAGISLSRNDLVPAGRRDVFPLEIGTRDRLRSGTFPLILEVALGTDPPDDVRVDRLLATDQVQLQIQGLSDVLKVLGVPTLFLLPGFLVLAALAALRSEWNWENATKPLSPTFWIIAIPVSMLISLAYTLLGGLMGRPADLSERFNLGDVAVVWLVSLTIGAVAGAVIRYCQTTRARKAQQQAGQDLAGRTIVGADPPLAVLEKLVRLGTSWPMLLHAAGTRQGFLVGPDGGDTRWLLPQTVLKREKPDTMTDETWEKLAEEFGNFLDGPPTIPDLVEGLKGRFAPLLPLKWRDSGIPYALGPQETPGPAAKRNFIFWE